MSSDDGLLSQVYWRQFGSMDELTGAIDATSPVVRNIVFTRLRLKRYLLRFREGPECSKGMTYALNAFNLFWILKL